MKAQWHLVVALMVAGILGLFAACGDTTDDAKVDTIAFTPIPTSTPVPKLCGNGEVDTAVGEECDPPEVGACGSGESCVCCLCLGEDEELGERSFSIARPPSVFITSATGGDVSTGVWLPGPLPLVAGRPDPNLPGEEACSASVSLREDVIFGFGIIDGSVYCVKFFAAGSTGVIDCDGGTAHDVLFEQDSNFDQEEDAPVITTGLGDPTLAGPGAFSLSLTRMLSVRLPVGAFPGGSTAADVCPGLDYEHARDIPGVGPNDVIDIPSFALTTETGTAILSEPLLSGGAFGTQPITIELTGQNYSCATWSQEDSEGTLIGPFAGPDSPVVNDTVNLIVIADQPPQ